MMQRKAKRVMRGKMPSAVKERWRKALDAATADKEAIDSQARAVFAAHDSAREVVTRLKAERERRGLSLTDMLRRTGMSREALSRLENHLAPNPTVRTLARYAAAVGMELHLAARRPRGD
jgi:DNA-binding phage protein